jgi:BON domain
MFHVGRSRGVRCGAMAVLVAAVWCASAGPQQAAEPAGPPPAKKLTFRDIQLTVHARKALADDPVLGPTNLGVRVQDNVAVLWGPVSSEAVKRRAVEVVKKVKGVYEARDGDVYIATPPTIVEAPPLPDPPPEAPTKTASASPDPATGAITALTGLPEASPPAAPVVVLKAPLPVEGKEASKEVAAAPPDGLAAGLERVRQSGGRFRAVEYRLEGDAVVLRPTAGRPEDAMAFARAISRLPGLSRIVVRGDEAGAGRP